MARIEVATPAEILAAEEKFAALVVASLGEVAARAARTLGTDIITAAVDTGPPGPGEPIPPPEQSAAAVEDLSIIPALWTVQVAATLMPELTVIYELSGGHILTALGEAFPDLADIPAASSFAAAEQRLANAQNRLVGIGDMLWEQARAQLLTGFSAGEDIGQLRDRVQASAGVSAARAERIARTEIISISNSGSIDQVRAAGLVGTKEWLDTPDERTRCTHRQAGGQTVDLDGKFQLGGGGPGSACPDIGPSYADFPGDPTLPAAEAINCRCSISYNVDIPALTAADMVNDQPLNGHTYSGTTLTEGGGLMPWHIVEDSALCPVARPYAVVKDATGQVEGCHPSRTAATEQLQALYAAEQAMAEQPCPEGEHRMPDGECMMDDEMPSRAPDSGYTTQRWEGTLAIEGVETGDGRMFALESLTWRDLPVPLMYQKVTSHGGVDDVTVNVGSIDEIWRDGNLLWGRGRLDMEDPNGVEVERKMRQGFLRGVSIDADSIKEADVEFVWAPRDPGASEEDSQLRELFAAPELTRYHKGRISAATVVNIPAFQEAKLFLVDSETGALVAAGAEADAAGLFAADAPTEAEVKEGMAAVTTAAYTIEIPDLPPADWFEEPAELPPIGALWVTAEGRVFGLVGAGDTAHRSFRDRRITIPMGNVDYTAWMNRPTIVQGGKRVATGVITMNCGHASPLGPLDPGERMKHYDNSCSIAAVVAVGESKKFGAPWISGALMPMDADQAQRLMACQLSGDWAPHREKPGWKEFVAALAVPVPGFARATKARVVDDVLVSSAVPIRSWEEYQASLTPGPEPVMVAAAVPALTDEQREQLDAVRDRLGLSAKAKLAAVADRVRTAVGTAPRPAPVPGTFEGAKAPVACAPCAEQAQRRRVKAAGSGDRHRAELNRIVTRVRSLQVRADQGPAPPAFHLPGQHPQKNHAREGGVDDEEDSPVAPPFELLDSVRVGGKGGPYHLAAFVDTEGEFGPVGGRLVAVSSDGRKPNWQKEYPQDVGLVVPEAAVGHFADTMDALAIRLKPFEGNKEGDEDVGPVNIESRAVDGFQLAAYHDPFGDLGYEGSTFVPVAAPDFKGGTVSWDDFDALFYGRDIEAVTAAMRRLAGEPEAAASGTTTEAAGDRHRVALSGIAARLRAFHLPGQHPQKNHGDGDGLPDSVLKGVSVLDQAGYEDLYGDVIDEEATDLGNGIALTARYFKSSDAHAVLDLPDGKYQVMEEMSPDGMRALADNLEEALDVDLEGLEPDSTGVVWDTDSREHDFYVAVDEVGDIRLRMGDNEGEGVDLSASEAKGFVEALRNMADGYDETDFDSLLQAAGGPRRRRGLSARVSLGAIARRVRAGVFHLPGKHPQKNHGDGDPADVISIPNDKLKLAGRIPLADGETLAGSDIYSTKGSGVVPMALVEGPDGPRLRIGTGILDEDKKRWAGRNLGSTANLDEAGIRQLRESLDRMRVDGDEAGRRFLEIEKREDGLDQKRRDIIKRQYRGLSKADAKKLDRLDRRVEELDENIERDQASLERSAEWLTENDPERRTRWDEINIELANLDPSDDDDAERIKGLQVEQARLVPSYPLKKMRDIPLMQEERADIERERQELTADATPLSPEDQGELADVDAELISLAQQHSEMAESVILEGEILGEWADMVYQVNTRDTATGYDDRGVTYRISARPKDADEDWDLSEDNGATELGPKELAKLEAVIGGLVAKSGGAAVA